MDNIPRIIDAIKYEVPEDYQGPTEKVEVKRKLYDCIETIECILDKIGW
ncbi:MAG: hypothetical protein KKF50_01965 [Nanoarchaeota archaeon]|nr:hypothetical protein [Nanoarchaeota archaeon]